MIKRGSHRRVPSVTPWLFIAPYAALLLAFGIGPALYAVAESFFDGLSKSRSLSLANYSMVFSDFRFWPAVLNTLAFMVVWIPAMMAGTIALALLLHERANRFSASMRLIYFLPGAVTGSAAVLLWYFMLQPSVSPFAPILRLLGLDTTGAVFNNGNLPWIFALMAFATGAGGWIVILYGAFQSVPHEVIESGRVDGAGPIRLALWIKLPLIRKYVLYMFILCFVAGLQIFTEPQLIHSIEPTAASNWWSVNQLGLQYAFGLANFGSAAVVSTLVFLVSLIGSLLVVFKTDFFDTEASR